MSDDVIDGLNRSAKLFMDSGAAKTLEEAVERLRGFRFHIAIGEAAARDATHQATLLTALNCGRRTFLGGVSVSGDLDVPLAVPIVPGASLGDAVRHLRGEVSSAPPPGVPKVYVGAPTCSHGSGFEIRTTFQGWRAALLPAAAARLDETVGFAPSGSLAGALAVAEVFAHLNGDPMAGHRAVGMSLWDASPSADWRTPGSDGPKPHVLPSDFWVIGLGHLGQAFLWTIGLLPYQEPREVRLYLQDVDVVGKSTESTSVLTFGAHEGRLKSRVCSDWAEARGFSTRLIERRFERDLRVGPDEPTLALCGVDNPQARAILEHAGFGTAFEAGLGTGPSDFRLIRTHSFPGAIPAARIWAEEEEDVQRPRAPEEMPAAYQDLHGRGALDDCGMTRLADVAVGAPFVGLAAAALVISQTVRLAMDGKRPAVVNLDLSGPQHRSAVMRDGTDTVMFRTAPACRADTLS